MPLDAHYLYQFLLILAFLLSIGVNVITLVRTGKSQRREVTMAEAFMTKNECSQVHRSLDQRIGHIESCVSDLSRKVDATHQDMAQSAEARASKLHQRVDEILRAVSRLEGAANSHR